jgi:6-pyruvoyltetrahydropterin/6-carboxytetrahydropterin synthase
LPAVSSAFLTRVVRFAAAHRYYRPEWTEAENRRVFGACANPVGHGHDYVLEVTVRGPVDPATGFSADLGALDALLRREVVQPLDHQHINHAVAAFREGGLIPTCENLLAWLWERIAPSLPGAVRLSRLRLREGRDLWVDFYGPDVRSDE